MTFKACFSFMTLTVVAVIFFAGISEGYGRARGGERTPIKYPYHTKFGPCQEMPTDFLAKRAAAPFYPPHFGDYGSIKSVFESSADQVSEQEGYPDMAFVVTIIDNWKAETPYRLLNATIGATGERAIKNKKFYITLESKEDSRFVDHYLLDNFDTCIITWKLDKSYPHPIDIVSWTEYWL